jgi:hypothetical protein
MRALDKVIVDYGTDELGRYYWRKRGERTQHGPFATEKEATRDSEVVIFGQQCEIKECGSIDGAVIYECCWLKYH